MFEVKQKRHGLKKLIIEIIKSLFEAKTTMHAAL
jgi:hypothetical protein